MNPALLVIDLQRWFLDVGSPQKKARVPELIAGCNELIHLFHDKGLPIVHVRTAHKTDGSTRNLWMKRNDRWTLIEGTTDVQEYPGVCRFDSDIVVTKTRTSAFVRTDLETTLRKLAVDTLVLAGFSTNRCVGLTAIDAYERDLDVLLARDAILGCDQTRGDLMLKYLHDEYAIEPVPILVILERLLSGEPG